LNAIFWREIDRQDIFPADPLGLSDPDGAGGFITPEWLRYSEVIHSRFAMLGAAGTPRPRRPPPPPSGGGAFDSRG